VGLVWAWGSQPEVVSMVQLAVQKAVRLAVQLAVHLAVRLAVRLAAISVKPARCD
jgi:hypothetical protein